MIHFVINFQLPLPIPVVNRAHIDEKPSMRTVYRAVSHELVVQIQTNSTSSVLTYIIEAPLSLARFTPW